MKVDVTTWCAENNRAGNYLANVLEKIDDEKLVGKVNVYIHRFHARVKALNGVEKTTRLFFLKTLLKETESNIELNVRHEKVKSLMLNLIKTFYRMELLKIQTK